MEKAYIFKNFGDFWHYTRGFSHNNIEMLFHALSESEQDMIKKSYENDGWADVFRRNQINRILDAIKKEMSIDLLAIKCRVMSGKSFYIKASDWDVIISKLNIFPEKDIRFIFGGFSVSQINKNTVLLARINEKES